MCGFIKGGKCVVVCVPQWLTSIQSHINLKPDHRISDPTLVIGTYGCCLNIAESKNA